MALPNPPDGTTVEVYRDDRGPRVYVVKNDPEEGTTALEIPITAVVWEASAEDRYGRLGLSIAGVRVRVREGTL